VKNPGTIRLEHVYKQSPERVWKALTDPALHARWWAPGDVRAEVGHRFELDMGKWGKQACEVIAVDPGRLFSYRFAEASLNTVITFQLAAEGTGTRLTFTQDGFDLDSPMGQQALDGMKSGWPGILAKLETVA
jgi:uncharacterized protein YndB with AHSA1/START domain